MKRDKLRAVIAKKIGCTIREAARYLNAVVDECAHAIDSDGYLIIQGFGVFGTRQKAPRRGYDMTNNRPCLITPRRVVTFKPGKGLKEAVNRDLPNQDI